MKHLDLFSGIGGFAYAIDQVWDNAEHIFCDNDKFCQQVLKKHWPNSKIYDDIRTITDTDQSGHIHGKPEKQSAEGHNETQREPVTGIGSSGIHILTGGFPCQPFSQAGRRRGTEDDRYLWPEMLRVIRLTQPEWIIAENVRGIVTWNEGMVLEQVCLDLEAEGYEVQPFIIPAVAVNAPHRRDRIWIVAYRLGGGTGSTYGSEVGECGGRRQEPSECERGEVWGNASNGNSDASNSDSGRIQRHEQESIEERSASRGGSEWDKEWLETATKLCGVDDGLPVELDGFKLSKAGHRNERLKSLGNAIVPQVAIEILKAIKNSYEL